MIENLVERHLEFQNVDVKMLSVSMKPESKDGIFLIWVDVAFMRIITFITRKFQGTKVSFANILRPWIVD